MSHDEKIKERLLKIWRMSCLLGAELEGLDVLCKSRSMQFAVLQSCQSQFCDWRGFNLGELMNLFGIPPENRIVKIKKGVVVDI